MNPYELVFLHRKCRRCGNEVPQVVFYNVENGDIKLGTYWKRCVLCKAFLPKPTEKEIRESPYAII